MTADRTADPFGTRLAEAVATRGPLCVGIDPHPNALTDWGLDVGVAGLERVARTLVEAVAGEVAVVKPQSAFYEAYGSAGIAVLERVLADAQALGALVLLDVKRGDIGSTMEAYASAYLADGSPLAADAITLSPYLGLGALAPAFELAESTGRGLFVLALTSNADGALVQRADSGGRSVAQRMVDEVGARNRAAGVTSDGVGARGLGSYGLVIGATHAHLDLDLTELCGPVLVPGLGHQGGTPEQIGSAFGAGRYLVLPSSSREIMAAGPDVAAIRKQAQQANAALRSLFSLRDAPFTA